MTHSAKGGAAMHNEYLAHLDTVIAYTDTLPCTVRSFVRPAPDGGYIVVVNKKLDEQTIRAAIAHELRHIALRHLHSTSPAAKLEKEV